MTMIAGEYSLEVRPFGAIIRKAGKVAGQTRYLDEAAAARKELRALASYEERQDFLAKRAERWAKASIAACSLPSTQAQAAAESPGPLPSPFPPAPCLPAMDIRHVYMRTPHPGQVELCLYDPAGKGQAVRLTPERILNMWRVLNQAIAVRAEKSSISETGL